MIVIDIYGLSHDALKSYKRDLHYCPLSIFLKIGGWIFLSLKNSFTHLGGSIGKK